MKQEGRLITDDWSHYNGKTYVTYLPRNMSPEQCFDGYVDFRKRFYSLSSFIKRMRVSKTHLLYNAVVNLGYRLAIRNRPLRAMGQGRKSS
jgi:hypothetical protein